MGPRGGFYAVRPIAILHRLSEDGGSVRGVRRGLPAELHEPERGQDARRAGHGNVVDAGWAQALFAYRGVARRRRIARTARHEEDRQRGRGAARLRGDRGRGRRGLDAATSRLLSGAAPERALDSRHRYDGEAALRSSGRSGGRLQSEEAWSTEPLLSHLLDGGHAIGLRRRRLRGRRTRVQSRLWALLARTPRDCWPALLRGDKGFG